MLDLMLSAEIQDRTGERGRQVAYRHGHQPGYVVWGGRKVAVDRPRLRTKGGGELPLETYQRFQEDGAMQRAVARQMMRKCSTRDYAGAVEEAVEGYGTGKSSASRHFKLATAKQLQELMEREVPKDLVALMLDAKHFADQCLVVALGITARGEKLVLGLWQGSTENATVVKELLGDLVRRGLNPDRPLLVVLDGGKALAKAVGEVFGGQAMVQRCRVHKMRNVLDHLPKPMKAKFAWRLKTAWQLRDHREVLAEMERINPSAGRSLREGLEETVTLQRLGINERLRTSLSSTNLIESIFSQAEAFTGRVKRWRIGPMAPRWCASALLWSEKKFRRIRGHQHLAALQATLKKETLGKKQKAA